MARINHTNGDYDRSYDGPVIEIRYCQKKKRRDHYDTPRNCVRNAGLPEMYDKIRPTRSDEQTCVQDIHQPSDIQN